MIVKLEQPSFNAFTDEIKAIGNVCNSLEIHQEGEEIEIDFSKIKFLHPFYILGLSSLINDYKGKGNNFKYTGLNNIDLSNYLKTMYFAYGGIKPDMVEDWGSILDGRKNKNYLPVINFSTSKEYANLNNKIFSKVNSLLFERMNLNNDLKKGVSYLISELTDNIFDHSNSERGLLAAQYYPNKHQLDLCFVDRGIGVFNSYKNNNYSHLIKNDVEAISKALKGLSTKPEKGRGHGLRSSSNMAINGLCGEFALISGKGVYYNNNYYEFRAKWDGTFIAMRITHNVSNFNIYDYV